MGLKSSAPSMARCAPSMTPGAPSMAHRVLLLLFSMFSSSKGINVARREEG